MAEWTTYRDRGGYSIEVPADWERDRYVVPADQAVAGASTRTIFSNGWGWVRVWHGRSGTGYYGWDSFGSFVAEEVEDLESDPEVEWVTTLEIDESHYRVEYLEKPPGYCDARVSRRYLTQGPYYGSELAIVSVLVCAAWYEESFVERILSSFEF